jgi:hypothetical protein
MPLDPDVNDVAAALQMSIGLCIRQLRQLQAEGELSLSEASALKRLDRNRLMGTTLRALEARGFVKRRPHPSDGRRVVLAITKSGTRVLGDKHNARAEQLAKVLSTGFSPLERRQLMIAAPLIERLAQNL